MEKWYDIDEQQEEISKLEELLEMMKVFQNRFTSVAEYEKIIHLLEAEISAEYKLLRLID